MAEEDKDLQTELRAASSLLAERIAFANLNGLTFEGNRDLTNIFGYDSVITSAMYRAKYERGGLAKRAVDLFPRATWRGDGELTENDDPNNDTEFEDAWYVLNDRLKIWREFQRVDTLAALTGYAVLLIGAPGELSTEIKRGKSEGLIYIKSIVGEVASNNRVLSIGNQAMGARWVKIEKWEEDVRSPRYGQPILYQLMTPATTTSTKPKYIHWSRVIHVAAEGALDDDIIGPPKLQAIWNYLHDLAKISGGGSEAFFLRANQGLHVNIDKDLQLKDAAASLEAMKESIEEYKNNINRVIRTRGAEVKALGSDTADFSNPVDAIETLIAATLGVPKRILLGSEMGELASTQDRDNWSDQVKDRRSAYAAPSILRPLIDRLIEYQFLPTPVEYKPRWPDVVSMGEVEKIDTANKAATINDHFAFTGEVVITADEIRDKYFGLPPLTPEQQPKPVEQPQKNIAAASRSGNIAEMAVGRAQNVRSALSRALRTGRELVHLAELERALQLRDIDRAIMAVVPASEMMFTALGNVLEATALNTLVAGAEVAKRQLPNKKSVRVAAQGSNTNTKVQITFDTANPRAVEWARSNSAKAVSDITTESRQAIQTIVARSIEEGISPRHAAMMIRTSIGLTENQANAVANLYARMLNSEGTTILAGKTRIRIPANGATPELLDRATQAYANRLLNQRAEAIAINENLEAAAEGQRMLWNEARSRGLLDGRELKTLIQADPCPKCLVMQDEVVGINEEFSGGLPPFHNRCQCVEGLV